MKEKKPNVQLSENSDKQLKELVVSRQPKTLNRVSKISVAADLIDKAHKKEIKNDIHPRPNRVNEQSN